MAALRWAVGPQSNQRGIETGVSTVGGVGVGACLNRTSVGLKRRWTKLSLFGARRLNRTSVGLKQDMPPVWRTKTTMPQSNQRGIETAE